MNTVTLSGNVVADAEPLVELEGGFKVLNFRIGNSERVTGPDGKPKNVDNGFFDIRAFGSLGENTAAIIRKGERVLVTGRLYHYTFEREDGSKGSRTTVTALSVGLSTEFQPAERLGRTRSAVDEIPVEALTPPPVEAEAAPEPAKKPAARQRKAAGK